MIMTSQYDVMRISHAIEGEHTQTLRLLSSGHSGTKHLGLLAIHRASTLAVLVPLEEQA